MAATFIAVGIPEANAAHVHSVLSEARIGVDCILPAVPLEDSVGLLEANPPPPLCRLVGNFLLKAGDGADFYAHGGKPTAALGCLFDSALTSPVQDACSAVADVLGPCSPCRELPDGGASGSIPTAQSHTYDYTRFLGCIYEHSDFGGYSLCLYGASGGCRQYYYVVPDLREWAFGYWWDDWNDKTSSYIVGSESLCGMTLFEHINLQGRTVSRSAGGWDSGLGDDGFNDKASSIRFRR
ncbi:MAG TPA: hypothetical protein VHH36_09990 [Candidatus Thermoplasmatota archaeon]|nr:hypothetical protein [Candidatus Thermoplasmatota archaeon]